MRFCRILGIYKVLQLILVHVCHSGFEKITGDDIGVESVTIINSPVGSPTTAGCNGCTGDVRIEDGICYCPYVV